MVNVSDWTWAGIFNQKWYYTGKAPVQPVLENISRGRHHARNRKMNTIFDGPHQKSNRHLTGSRAIMLFHERRRSSITSRRNYAFDSCFNSTLDINLQCRSSTRVDLWERVIDKFVWIKTHLLTNHPGYKMYLARKSWMLISVFIPMARLSD